MKKKTFNATLTLHCNAKATGVLQGDDQTADHVLSALCFTARFVEGSDIMVRRVGVILTTDKESIGDGLFFSPEMVDALLEQFFIMISHSAGPSVMLEVLAIRQERQAERDVDTAMNDIGFGCDNNN